MTYANAIYQWEEGERRLDSARPAHRRTLERVVGRVVDDLRRRLGGTFTSEELSELYYADGTDWCLEIALAEAPEEPEVWDTGLIADAAFARYVREAADWAGGRRR